MDNISKEELKQKLEAEIKSRHSAWHCDSAFLDGVEFGINLGREENHDLVIWFKTWFAKHIGVDRDP